MTTAEPKITITIDGTAGSGKSALGRLVSAKLNYLFVDTGAYYRALTLAATRAQVSTEDGPRLAALALKLDIRIETSTDTHSRELTLLIGEEDVTCEVRSPAVDAAVSQVAAHAETRAALLPRQRHLAQQKGLVMVGRDIGTVVCPNAEVKVYLVADLETRAKRRRQEFIKRGEPLSSTDVTKNLTARDLIDRSRGTAPLTQHPDAIVLDTGLLTLEQELAIVLAKIKLALKSQAAT